MRRLGHWRVDANERWREGAACSTRSKGRQILNNHLYPHHGAFIPRKPNFQDYGFFIVKKKARKRKTTKLEVVAIGSGNVWTRQRGLPYPRFRSLPMFLSPASLYGSHVTIGPIRHHTLKETRLAAAKAHCSVRTQRLLILRLAQGDATVPKVSVGVREESNFAASRFSFSHNALLVNCS